MSLLELIKSSNLKSEFSGTDHPNLCINKDHFKNYNKTISYEYNSRGFRDREWPEDLSDVIWCVGDSCTLGIGQPYKETWPSILEKKIGKRCLNLGEHSCSNDTMAIRVKEIKKNFNPKLIIIMWSYFHRRRVNEENVISHKHDFGIDKDLENFIKNFQLVNNLDVSVINLLAPGILTFINKDHLIYFFKKEKIKNVLIFDQLDWARDYYHFDIKTSKFVCNLILNQIKMFDKQFKYIL